MKTLLLLLLCASTVCAEQYLVVYRTWEEGSSYSASIVGTLSIACGEVVNGMWRVKPCPPPKVPIKHTRIFKSKADVLLWLNKPKDIIELVGSETYYYGDPQDITAIYKIEPVKIVPTKWETITEEVVEKREVTYTWSEQ